MNKKLLISTVGRRKRAVASATLTEGTGKVRVNHFLLSHLEPVMARMKIMEPLLLAGDISKINIRVRVNGGGQISQADAVRVAIGRALVEHNKKLQPVFLEYDRNILVPDVRYKESAKPNRHGNARSKTQKSYR
jgi:small subunit ribosomal protein S9